MRGGRQRNNIFYGQILPIQMDIVDMSNKMSDDFRSISFQKRLYVSKILIENSWLEHISEIDTYDEIILTNVKSMEYVRQCPDVTKVGRSITNLRLNCSIDMVEGMTEYDVDNDFAARHRLYHHSIQSVDGSQRLFS